jgi:hypothetical protein
MQIDWFLVELAVITIPLLAWGFWMVVKDRDRKNEAGQSKALK